MFLFVFYTLLNADGIYKCIEPFASLHNTSNLSHLHHMTTRPSKHPFRHSSRRHTTRLKPDRDAPTKEEYECEAIRDIRIIEGKRQYLVKWKNYG